MHPDISIEKVYEIATELAPRIYQKLNFHEGSFGPEDVVNEYLLKVLEKNYLENFDPKKGNLRNYVYQGLRNTAINQIRKCPEFRTLGTTTIEDLSDRVDWSDINNSHAKKSKRDKVDETDLALASEIPMDGMSYTESEILLNELMELVSDLKFSKNIVVTLDGKEVEADGRVVLKLLWEGFSKSKIADFLKVSEPTVSSMIEKMKKKGLTREMILG